MNDKVLLSISEASELFGIGQHRLRKILSDDYERKYHLMAGQVIRIKRKPFEEYINREEQV